MRATGAARLVALGVSVALLAIPPAVRGGEESGSDCPPNAVQTFDFGLEYHFEAGDFLTREGVDWIRFLTEPVIRRVDPGGPSTALRSGDVLVAVEGVPITTREGSLKFAGLETAQDEVALTVRRGGRLVVAPIRPKRRCEAVEGRSASSDADSSSGWLGLSLRFREDGGFRDEQPVVTRVVPTSVADRAGIQVGDIVLTIAGRWATQATALEYLGSPPGPGVCVTLGLRRETGRVDVGLDADGSCRP